MDPETVQAILKCSPHAPESNSWGSQFFTVNSSQIPLPITKTKGEEKPKHTQPLTWTMECQVVFTAKPILKYLVPNAPDASDVAVGVIIASEK